MKDLVKADGVLNRIIPILLAGKTFLGNNNIATPITGGQYEQSICNAQGEGEMLSPLCMG